MLRFRKLTLSDIEQLIEIEKSASQAFACFSELAWLAECPVMPAEIHADLINTSYTFAAVDDNDQVVGFLYAKKHEADLYIIEFDVHAGFQQQGIGRKLLQYAIENAKKEKFEKVTLTTFIEVPWNAPFYAKLGFRILSKQCIPPYLQNTLQSEATFGFDTQTRCAMYLDII